ncbi:hypothetical protein [uncultured Bacteroides sp.]|uniref:hypothetical protein n=1 Tax=uncultured Bacteroides sp. TaxID=162156 RepID=UPI0026210548|nr:hypothetical protein [uncultured Bacteroides sp.]
MKRYILSLLLLFGGICAYSQVESTLQRVNIKSPEVSSFMKVGDIPVSLYTGVPKISIPLYEVKNGALTLPITLDYQGTAIQVNQEATWVGLNWLMNAGGIVTTRTTKPDANTLQSDWDFLYNKLKLMSVGGNDLGQVFKMDGNHESGRRGKYGFNRFKGILTPTDTDISFELYAKILDNYEGEAQSYCASFMGYNFDFVYHPLQKRFIVTGNAKNFKIDGGTNYITSITDDRGIKYTFGTQEINTPEAYTNAPYASRSTTFYLTQIQHPDGRTINLRYKQYGSIRLLPEILERWYFNYPKEVNYKVDKKLSDVVKINNYYLYEITTDYETVRFNVGTRIDLKGGRRLDNIEVYDKSGSLVKRFRFTYNYQTSNGVGGDRLYEYYEEHNQLSNYHSLYANDVITKRLNLTSLQEEVKDSSGTTKKLPPYRFTYNPVSLPSKTSSARDYWGFYNGQNNKTLLVDRNGSDESGYNSFPYSASVVCANRRCNPNTICAGMLTGIIYPTGGKSSFAYEPHVFSNFTYYDVNYKKPVQDFSYSVWNSDMEISVPSSCKSPKDFTLSQETEIQVSVKHTCPQGRYWRDMLGSPGMILDYKERQTSSGTVATWMPYRIWTLNPIDTLRSVNGVSTKVERMVLPAGKYRIQVQMSAPQLSWPDPKGDKKVEITIKNVKRDYSYGGGVRIREIVQTPLEGTPVTTRYEYTEESGETTGLLMYPLHFARKKLLVHQLEQYYGNTTYQAASLKNYWVVSSEDMTPRKGILVGYGKVGVEQGSGKTVYEFWNRCRTNRTFDYCPPLPDPRNGSIEKELVYDSDEKLVKKETRIYTILQAEHHYINAIVEDIYYGPQGILGHNGNLYADLCNGGRMLFCIYPSSQFQFECIQKNVEEYQNGDTLFTRYDYTYSPHSRQVSTIKVTYNSALSRTTHWTYPQDYVGSGFPVTLKSKNILTAPIEKVTVLNKDGGSYVISGELNRYDEKGRLSVYSRLCLSEPLNLSDFKFSNKRKGEVGTDTLNRQSFSPYSGYKEELSLQYTNGGNIQQMTRNSLQNTIYLWSYNRRHLIAKIVNASLEQVKTALGYTTDTQLSSLENNESPNVGDIRSKLDNYFKGKETTVVTYTYKPFAGITSITEPNGEITYFDYDEFARLRSIKDHQEKTVQNFEYHYSNQ